ncbi:MAG: aldo/keto reductase [Eggerthellaceae bacterium]|nr:aldo/keto reductase [Eggerthellaceae bacterium]
MAYADNYLGHDIAKLGFGLMRLPGTQGGGDPDLEQVSAMVDAFIDAGFTYFDTAYVYDGGKSEQAAKAALVERYPRESFQLATKMNAWLGKPSESETKAQFETSLERTGAGYFDFYLVHAVQSDNHDVYDNYGIWDFVQQKKAEGLVRNWGFSFHSTPGLLRQILDTHDRPDFIQLQINYADWEEPSIASRENYEICAEAGIPVVVMEPLRGGALANPPEAVGAPLAAANPTASFASWGIRFAASLPGIVTVLSGMSTIEQMEDNLSYMRNFEPLGQTEQDAIAAAQAELAKIDSIPCTGCGYCLDDCPIHMSIPNIFTAANREIVYGMTENAKRLYGMHATETRASDCLKCGNCESACPQGIPIISWLERAGKMFD